VAPPIARLDPTKARPPGRLAHHLADSLRIHAGDDPSAGHGKTAERRPGLGFVSALLGSPGLGVPVPTERHGDVAEQVIVELPWLSGNLVHDAHTAILICEHGVVRICTRDTDFHRFPFLEVVEPD
jgi:hypothetical protein